MLIQKAQPASVKLIPSDNGTRYKCVYDRGSKDPTRRYEVAVSRGSVRTVIGRFATLEDAAICYAHSPEGQKHAAKLAEVEALQEEQNMTSAEARATAAKEGLELHTHGSHFVGVYQNKKTYKLPFVARVQRSRKTINLGYFRSAEAAALCYARSPEGRAAAEAKRAEAQAPPPMTAPAALAAAAEEGLVLPASGSSGTRFQGVYSSAGTHCSLPFFATYRRDGFPTSLGCFATAEEAALCRARALAAPADAPAAAADELVATCPICIEPIDAGSEPVATTCLHVFCRGCIAGWLDQAVEATCPMCREPLEGALGQLTAVPLPAAADTSSAPRRSGWTLREWRLALEQRASVEAKLAARAEATARSDEQQAAFVYHSGVPRPVDLARAGFRPLFSQRRGGHMARGEAHPRAARPVRPDPPGNNYAEVKKAQRRLDARRRLDTAAKKQKKGEGQ
ncbi:hypothetical protein EMIHUDRAFT_98995 [Emiliania huxleyi CCMP1516]|uniref:RING-type domain-containing protein n=2 Tax=Emiliania huxleyi TaxID=2903 RepID=A0A0D3K899_EMIH1|nr:hypothetical protein EMIHUDRAFT_98995 [Emiliania huxleyi CCMP1516]EOD31984.1 hypothetical protein EMIHUDRAFT_98995 [Emiliania huxleyi CCMP1516]|eukprot:XP_005784413.1 hypothetical protein EMIHUDRAFT_98995 [Emiliania huxleyi CCMP1516]